MSRISRKKELNKTTIEETTASNEDQMMAEEEPESTLNFTESKQNEENIARVVFEANATADQLARGHTVRLSGAKDIFTSDLKDADYAKGIITGIK